MTTTALPSLSLIAEELAVCRLPMDASVPNWAWYGELTSITSSDSLKLQRHLAGETPAPQPAASSTEGLSPRALS